MVYYNVIKSLRKEGGLAPCCLVEECLPDIPRTCKKSPGLQRKLQIYEKAFTEFLKLHIQNGGDVATNR